jgi:hypothetical protein
MPEDSPDSANGHHNSGDSIGYLGFAVAVILWVVSPGVMTRALAIVLAVGVLVYLCYRAHWVRNMEMKWRHVLAGAVVVVIGGGLALYLNHERKALPSLEMAKPAPISSSPTTPQSVAAAPAVVKPSESHAPTAIPAKIQGSNNTVVGNVPARTINGNENTIVGATDDHGNTILNRGGTAIGAGAHADPTSIAIGANAAAGQPVPTYQQTCQGSACAQGPGAQATYNQFGPPEARIVGGIEKIDDSSGYKVMVSVTVLDNWQNAAFVVKCNRPCTGDGSVEGLGAVGTRNWTASENPDWVVMKIEIPSMVPQGAVIHWWIRSNDGKPITITSIQKADIKMASQ